MYSCNCGDRIEITEPGNRKHWNRILSEQKHRIALENFEGTLRG
jgi:hypothetical protein